MILFFIKWEMLLSINASAPVTASRTLNTFVKRIVIVNAPSTSNISNAHSDIGNAPLIFHISTQKTSKFQEKKLNFENKQSFQLYSVSQK